jgi:hypothetical protein
MVKTFVDGLMMGVQRRGLFFGFYTRRALSALADGPHAEFRGSTGDSIRIAPGKAWGRGMM